MKVAASHFLPLIERLFPGAWEIQEDREAGTISFFLGMKLSSQSKIDITEDKTLIPLRIATGSNDFSIFADSSGRITVTIKNVTKFPTPP